MYLEDEGSWPAEETSRCPGEDVEEMAHQPQHLPHIFVCLSHFTVVNERM